jgi:DNA-binding SARP family transcriptional activator
MEASAAAGRRGDALRCYVGFVKMLREELGVTPDVETTALRDAIGCGRLQRSASPASAPEHQDIDADRAIELSRALRQFLADGRKLTKRQVSEAAEGLSMLAEMLRSRNEAQRHAA